MLASFFSGGENSRGFNNVVSSSIFPWNSIGVTFTIDVDFHSIDDSIFKTSIKLSYSRITYQSLHFLSQMSKLETIKLQIFPYYINCNLQLISFDRDISLMLSMSRIIFEHVNHVIQWNEWVIHSDYL